MRKSELDSGRSARFSSDHAIMYKDRDTWSHNLLRRERMKESKQYFVEENNALIS